MNKEQMIVSCLVTNQDFTKKVLPYVKLEYFQNQGIKTIVEIFIQFWEKYKQMPSRDALAIELESRSLNEKIFEQAKESLINVKLYNESLDWLVETTEQYFKDRALYIALMRAIETADATEQTARGEIPTILSKALSVSFNTSIGLDLYDDDNDLWNRITQQYDRIPTHLSMINHITRGGIPRKSLTVVLGPTGAGKSLIIQNLGAGMAKNGSNVLIVSLELSEEMIAVRLLMDSLDMDTSEILSMPKDVFMSKLKHYREKYLKGKLLVKEYPPRTITTLQIQHLLDEYRTKKGFSPDVLVVDYLTLFKTSSTGENSYSGYKEVAEDLRAIAVRNNLVCITAMQTNRTGYGVSDYGIESTGDSMGVPMTTDIQMAIIRTEELDDKGLIMIKQMKNRMREESLDRRFVLGVNRSRMRLYDADDPRFDPSLAVPPAPSSTTETKPPIHNTGFRFD